MHHGGDESENKLSAGWIHQVLLYSSHTTEGTMCLQWQVAIVHNVLMLTRCQFDPWDRWMGSGCGSWILKQATVCFSYGDGRRHDTDETSNYLPNFRQIQGGGRKTADRTDDGLSITFGKGTKEDLACISWCYLSTLVIVNCEIKATLVFW